MDAGPSLHSACKDVIASFAFAFHSQNGFDGNLSGSALLEAAGDIQAGCNPTLCSHGMAAAKYSAGLQL